MSAGDLPQAVEGLQLNFCKTLACDNFGLSDAHRYIVQQTNPKRPAMVCRECGAFPPLLNNQDVLEEFQRIKADQSADLPGCRNKACENFGLTIHTHKHLYHAFGYSGERQRYRCKCCQSTFVDKWSSSNRKLALQESLLGLLFTGYSVREICRKLHINPKSFYDHIEHIASRCRSKLAMFDQRWLNHASKFELGSFFVPLQPKSNNGVYWLASGDAHSGYILFQSVNYSLTDSPEGELEHNPFRSPARYVALNYQPESSLLERSNLSTIREQIDNQYRAILARNNVEDPLSNLTSFHYPSKGALIRPPYASYAHYLQLFSLCPEDKPLALYLPQDPFLRSAALTIGLPRIRAKNLDLMYVVGQWGNESPLEKVDIIHMGWWRDRWAIAENHQYAKGICYLAGEQSSPKLWLQKASTDAISTYQERFHLLFESFVNEPRRKLRPAGLLPVLDIYRAWHNLCYQKRDGLTAAQSLGLANAPISLKQLLS